MATFDFYSSRRKQASSTSPDVWIYDSIPQALRVQVSNILRAVFGTTNEYSKNSRNLYDSIVREVAHEHGRLQLNSERTSWGQLHHCLLIEDDTDVWLDVVEMSFRVLEHLRGGLDKLDRHSREMTMTVTEAIDEFNERCRRAGFGYRYENKKIIRIDNEFTHAEMTVAVLKLLHEKRFEGADAEFRAAYDHFKAGEHKDATVDALNALESTMKTICDAKGWEYTKGARVSDLAKTLKRNGLFPDYLDSSFEQLLATLKSGLSNVRNDSGAHGQGPENVQVPASVAAYALHLAGSKIRFLVELFNESER